MNLIFNYFINFPEQINFSKWMKDLNECRETKIHKNVRKWMFCPTFCFLFQNACINRNVFFAAYKEFEIFKQKVQTGIVVEVDTAAAVIENPPETIM